MVKKHEELKSRIDNVTAWDKEVDDILQEILGKTTYEIKINNFHSDADGANIEVYLSTLPPNIHNFQKFRWNNQCEKLEAFKKALHWLLDNSDIKDDKEPLRKKIEELEKQLNDLKNQI